MRNRLTRLASALSEGTPPVVRTLLLLNLGGYALQATVPDLTQRLALIPSAVYREHSIWRLFTAMFVHQSLLQLLVNVAALWACGRVVEKAWGARRFLTWYLICGLASALTVLLVDPRGSGTVGAQGAVIGVIGAFALLFPNSSVQFMMLLPLPAWGASAILAALTLALTRDGAMLGQHLDVAAHLSSLSGVVCGLLYHRYTWLGRIWLHRVSKQPSSVPLWQRRDLAPPVPPRPRDASRHVDAILDKIAREGMEALSGEERRLLEQASRRLQEGDADAVFD